MPLRTASFMTVSFALPLVTRSHLLRVVTPYLQFGAKEDSLACVKSRLHQLKNTVQSFGALRDTV